MTPLFALLSTFALAALLLLSYRAIRYKTAKKPLISKSDEKGTSTPPSTEDVKRAEKIAPSPLESFPPSRHAELLTTYDRLPSTHPLRSIPRNVLENVSDVSSAAKLVPFNVPADSLHGTVLTPTGFSVDEVRKLGDFPDYATLSGVPLPEKYEGFDIDKAIARPYRPFRWGYHQTMSLTKLEPDWWLELTKEYRDTINYRLHLFETRGKEVLQYLPGSEYACKELMEMIIQFLCARYPTYFTLHSPSSASNPNRDYYLFENRILEQKILLDGSQHPLVTILHHVPEDFALMMRNPETGIYHLRAGVICSSLGWTLGTKMGMKLEEVHGPVPDYVEKMRFSMDRFFSKMPTNQPIQRGSWGLEVDKPLFMPAGDPHEEYRLYQLPEKELPISRVHLRLDWQTLRRLPLSGAIVFNFKGLFEPVENFREEPCIPKLVLKVLNEGKKSIMEYKNTWHVEHVTKPLLKQWAEEQEESGLVEKGWEEKTLEDSPFFPGWEKIWRKRQGF